MQRVKLNDVCEINIGKTPSRGEVEYWGDGESWISIADLGEKYISSTKEQITQEAIEQCNMKVIPKDTVIMSFKLTIGKTAITAKDIYSNEAIANFPIKDKNKVMTEYLYYALRTLNFEGTTDRAVMGATLNKAKLNELEIPMTDMHGQKMIVNLLNKAQQLIDKRKEQIQACEELIKSQFIEMFGDLAHNEKGWKTATINEMCKYIYGGGTPSKSQPNYYIGEIPWVTPKDMKQLVVSDSIDHITEEAIQNSSAKLIPVDSVLMVIRSGILKRTLPVAINSVEVAVNQDMKAFIPKENVNSKFLMYTFISRENELLGNVRAVTADNIEFSIIKNLVTPCPPIELQNEFAQFVQQVDKLKFGMEQSLKGLEANFDSLMQRAFKGELF